MYNNDKKRFPYIRILVAAIILFLVATVIYKVAQRPSKAQRDKTKSEEISKYRKQDAFERYALRDFKNAKPLLKELWEKEKDTTAYYYLGMSYWYTGDTMNAKKVLDQALFYSYQKPY